MGGMSTTPVVLTHIAGLRRGHHLTRAAVAEATRLTIEQVRAAMYGIMKQPNPPVETIVRGHSWRVLTGMPAAAEPDPDLFTGRITDRPGQGRTLIIQTPDGDVWLAKRLGRAED